MLVDLERLVRLQQIETAADQARRRLDSLPLDHQALDARLAAAQAVVNAAKESLAASAATRREVEKELAVVQGRLSKFKDQLMEVKTNKEYQAMQKEIATAEREVRSFEDRILDRMEEGEALQADVKRGEGELKKEMAEIAAAREALEAERKQVDASLEALSRDRAAVAHDISPAAMEIFDHVSRSRKPPAVVEARDGHCSFCHVRLRPQIYNEVRRNAALIQCESCNRLLFFAAVPAAAEPVNAPGPASE